jgi:hypothetical protein
MDIWIIIGREVFCQTFVRVYFYEVKKKVHYQERDLVTKTLLVIKNLNILSNVLLNNKEAKARLQTLKKIDLALTTALSEFPVSQLPTDNLLTVLFFFIKLRDKFNFFPKLRSSATK